MGEEISRGDGVEKCGCREAWKWKYTTAVGDGRAGRRGGAQGVGDLGAAGTSEEKQKGKGRESLRRPESRERRWSRVARWKDSRRGRRWPSRGRRRPAVRSWRERGAVEGEEEGDAVEEQRGAAVVGGEGMKEEDDRRSSGGRTEERKGGAVRSGGRRREWGRRRDHRTEVEEMEERWGRTGVDGEGGGEWIWEWRIGEERRKGAEVVGRSGERWRKMSGRGSGGVTGGEEEGGEGRSSGVVVAGGWRRRWWLQTRSGLALAGAGAEDGGGKARGGEGRRSAGLKSSQAAAARFDEDEGNFATLRFSPQRI